MSVLAIDSIPQGQTRKRKNIAWIHNGKFFVNVKFIPQSFVWCALADGAEMFVIDDGKYMGVNCDYVLARYKESNDLEMVRAIEKFRDRSFANQDKEEN